MLQCVMIEVCAVTGVCCVAMCHDGGVCCDGDACCVAVCHD